MPAFGLCISRNRADAPQAHTYYTALKAKSERSPTPLANPEVMVISISIEPYFVDSPEKIMSMSMIHQIATGIIFNHRLLFSAPVMYGILRTQYHNGASTITEKLNANRRPPCF